MLEGFCVESPLGWPRACGVVTTFDKRKSSHSHTYSSLFYLTIHYDDDAHLCYIGRPFAPKLSSQGSQGIVGIFQAVKKFKFCAAREIWIRFIRFIKIQIINGLDLTDDGMHAQQITLSMLVSMPFILPLYRSKTALRALSTAWNDT